MSVTHSPPGNSSEMQRYDSEPILIQTGSENPQDQGPSLQQDLTRTGPTTRSKYKYGGGAGGDKRDEMREMFAMLKEDLFSMLQGWRAEQDTKLTSLQSTIEEIKVQNVNINRSLEYLNEKYEQAMIQIDNRKQECAENRKHIEHLEQKIDQLETNARSSCLEIRNVPKRAGESQRDLLEMARALGRTVGVQVDTNNINNIYRAGSGKSTYHPSLILKLNSVLVKENIIASVKKFNKNNTNNKLNLKHITTTGESSHQIYVSEHLTPTGRRLFGLAREYAKANRYTYCWTARGRIYLREQDGAPYIRIENESHLNALKVNQPKTSNK